MKRLILQCGLLGLLSVLVLILGASGYRPAHATGPVVGPTNATYNVLGTWQDSQVDLLSDVSGAPSQVDLPITDQSYLRAGWIIRIDSEKMCIQSLIDGGVGQPDRMIVERACGTPTADYHAAGTLVQSKAITIDIPAQNIPGPDGLGAFEVHVTLPPNAQFIQGVNLISWLTGTGRNDYWCDSPGLFGDTWKFGCSTTGATPPGPTGTGVIARVTILPPQTVGSSAIISLAGSQIADITGYAFDATTSDIRIYVVGCPDANLDGRVTISDITLASKSTNAAGVDSLATLSANLNTTDTQVPISQVGLLQVNDTIAIDAELMTVQTVNPTPPTITVTRGNQATPARTHNAGTIVYRDTVHSSITGTYNYTWPRDPNHDTRVTVSDVTLIARVAATQSSCPTP